MAKENNKQTKLFIPLKNIHKTASIKLMAAKTLSQFIAMKIPPFTTIAYAMESSTLVLKKRTRFDEFFETNRRHETRHSSVRKKERRDGDRFLRGMDYRIFCAD